MSHKIIYIAVCFTLLIISCQEQRESKSIYDPNEQAPFTPVISEVIPANSALADFTEIQIKGQGFSSDPGKNVVYFGNIKAEIISASTNELKVKAPSIIDDSLMIQVVVEGAFETAKFAPYQLEPVQSEYGFFGNLDKVQTIALDGSENLFVFMDTREFFRVDEDGQRTLLSAFRYPRVLDMKAGPGDYLYVLAHFLKFIYRVPITGGDIEEWIELPNRIFSLDFDANYNIYTAGTRTGIYRVKQDGTMDIKGDHADFTIDLLRVYNDYLYFLGTYSGSNSEFAAKGMWRSKILDADGNIGDPEQVLDWAETGNYATKKYFSFTFSLDGDIYIGTDYSQPILHIDQGGAMDSLYQNLLVTPSSKLEWGNDTFLYINAQSQVDELRRVFRVQMSKEGAPYYGRQ